MKGVKILHMMTAAMWAMFTAMQIDSAEYLLAVVGFSAMFVFSMMAGVDR